MPADDDAVADAQLVDIKEESQPDDEAAIPPREDADMSQPSLDKVTLPPWNAGDPRLWFKQVEDCFALLTNTDGDPAVTNDKQKLTL